MYRRYSFLLSFAFLFAHLGQAQERFVPKDGEMFGPDLRISLVSEWNLKNQSRAVATFARKGNDFSAPCSLGRGYFRATSKNLAEAKKKEGGKIHVSRIRRSISCSLEIIDEVHGEDGEQLFVSIGYVKRDKERSYWEIEADYVGDGTFFGKQQGILFGDHSTFYADSQLKRVKGGKERGPFSTLVLLESALYPAIGKEFSFMDGGVKVSGAISGFNYSIDDKNQARIRVLLGDEADYDTSLPSFSLLKNPKKKDSTFATRDEITKRLWAALGKTNKK